MSREPIPKLGEGSLPALEQCRCFSLAAATLVYERPLLCIGGSLLRRDEFALVVSMLPTPLVSARSLNAETRTELDTASLFSLLVLPCAGRMDEDEAGELGRERTLLCLGGSLLYRDKLSLVMSKSPTPLVSARPLEANARTGFDAAYLWSLLVLSRAGRMVEEEAGEFGRERTLLCIGGSLFRSDRLTLVMSKLPTSFISARSLKADARIELDAVSLFSLLVLPRAGRMDEDEAGEFGYERTLFGIGDSLLHRDRLTLVMSELPTSLISARSLKADARIELDAASLFSLFALPRCRSG